MEAKITLLPGDGVGPEVVNAAVQVLETIASRNHHTFTFTEALFGIAGINATGEALPKDTLAACEDSDAILLGAVGGPAGSTPPGSPRPEAGLLGLRKHFGFFANLRPVKAYPMLIDYVPLKKELVDGVDILFVRELTGGIYFGTREEANEGNDHTSAHDTMLYTTPEVTRIGKIAFDAAQQREKTLVSVDKANVLASSRLWRTAIDTLHQDYPDISVEHALVDSFAMRLMTHPNDFDVVVTGNMFGDILSDQASVLAGSLGMLPSASLNAEKIGLYEPIHGSAPDIAGQGIANPTGTILSAAMLLRHSLGLENEAKQIEDAVEQALNNGARTGDISGDGERISTQEFTTEVINAL